MNDEQGIMNIEGYSLFQHSEFVIQYSIFSFQPSLSQILPKIGRKIGLKGGLMGSTLDELFQ